VGVVGDSGKDSGGAAVKVWLVMSGCVGDWSVQAAFSSLDGAEAYAREIGGDVDEYDLDPLLPSVVKAARREQAKQDIWTKPWHAARRAGLK
jgi:hypothetical protein